MTMPMLIRTARESDVEPIRVLLSELGYELPPEKVADNLGRYHDLPGSAVLVGILEGTLVGMVSGHSIPLMHEEGDLGRITSLVTSSGQRSRGIGSRLVTAMENRFREGGCVRVEVTSGERRGRAHAFYLANEYESSGRRFVKRLQSARETDTEES